MPLILVIYVNLNVWLLTKCTFCFKKCTLCLRRKLWTCWTVRHFSPLHSVFSFGRRWQRVWLELSKRMHSSDWCPRGRWPKNHCWALARLFSRIFRSFLSQRRKVPSWTTNLASHFNQHWHALAGLPGQLVIAFVQTHHSEFLSFVMQTPSTSETTKDRSWWKNLLGSCSKMLKCFGARNHRKWSRKVVQWFWHLNVWLSSRSFLSATNQISHQQSWRTWESYSMKLRNLLAHRSWQLCSLLSLYLWLNSWFYSNSQGSNSIIHD